MLRDSDGIQGCADVVREFSGNGFAQSASWFCV